VSDAPAMTADLPRLAPRNGIAPSRAQRWTLSGAMALVAAIAGWLHGGGLHDVIAWDEANYVFAAKEGLFANATQLGELSQLRHRHAPLTCYAIAISTAVFGADEWAIRFPAVVISAISCGLLVLIAYDLARGAALAHRLIAGVVAGLILATSPASIELAGVIQPHSFVVFFLLLNLWSLARYLRDLHRRDAVLFGLSLAGQFVTMEYGPVILFYALLAVALTKPALLFGEQRSACDPISHGIVAAMRRTIFTILRTPLTMHRDLKAAAAACLIASAAIWPAGVFLLGIPFNFVFFLLYAANGHPVFFRGEMHLHVPKYAYAYWYWLDYPLLTIGMIAAMLLIIVWAWRSRTAVAMTLAVFTLGLTASVHGAHIMQVCKSIFMIPPIALGGPLAALWLRSAPLPLREGLGEGRAPDELDVSGLSATRPSPNPSLGGRGMVLASLAVSTVLGARSAPMSRENDPNERLVAMARVIADEAGPNEQVLAQGWPMVRYLLHLKFNRPDIAVHRYDPRNYTIDRLGDRIAVGDFQWAVTIGPMVAANSDCRVLAELRQAWRVIDDQSFSGREYRVYQHRSDEAAVEHRAADANEKEGLR